MARMSILSFLLSRAERGNPITRINYEGQGPLIVKLATLRQLMMPSHINCVATLKMMKDMAQIERLNPIAGRAWKCIESAFPSWVAHLDIRDGELEFALPAPSGSAAGHLVAFTQGNDLWLRFSPPYMCYSVDDENEMVSLIKQLTADEAVFKVVTRGDEWMESL